MLVAIYGRTFQNHDAGLISQLFDLFEKNKIDFVIEKKFLNKLSSSIQFHQQPKSFESYKEIRSANFLFSLGGDGTLLDTVALVRDSNIPVIGINIGRLGFLASISKDQIEEAINAVVSGNFILDKRTLIHLESDRNLFDDVNYGLNDFTIHRKDTSSMMVVRAKVNGELMGSYWADGLIISTPTGSTGYNLSCGGPIIFPDSGNFVVTPIAPHNLSMRPIILNDNAEISLEIEGRGEKFLANLDSRAEVVDSSCKLLVRKEKFMFNLVRLNNMNFLSTLRAKLMWGADKRN